MFVVLFVMPIVYPKYVTNFLVIKDKIVTLSH